jgi:hypothetical protein
MFDTLGPMSYLLDLLTNLEGPDGSTILQSVTMGAPLAFQDRVSAFVALGEQQLSDSTFGVVQRDTSYYIGMGYRMPPNQAIAETTLANAIDAFIAAFYRDRTLGGTVPGKIASELDLSLAKVPAYQTVADQSYRIYALLVRVRQTWNTRA